MTSLAAGPGLTTIWPLAGVVRPLPEKLSEMVSGVSSERPANVAIPPVKAIEVVPSKGPVPVASRAVIKVLLSPVSRLPYWSTS